MSDVEIELWHGEEKVIVVEGDYEGLARMDSRTIVDNTVGTFGPHVTKEVKHTIVLSDKNHRDFEQTFVPLRLDVDQIEHQLRIRLSDLISEWRS